MRDLLSILIDDALAKNDPRVTLSLYTAPTEDDPFTVADDQESQSASATSSIKESSRDA